VTPRNATSILNFALTGSRVRRPKMISRGGDPTMIFPSGQPLVITVPMNDTGLFASHSTSGGGFQPGAIEHAAPSLAGMAKSNAHIANAALFLFTDFPPGTGSAAPVLPGKRPERCSAPIYGCACRDTRLLLTTRNSAPSRFKSTSKKLSDLPSAANLQRLRTTRQPRRRTVLPHLSAAIDFQDCCGGGPLATAVTDPRA
jgi:hypothetical protein